MTFLNQKKYIIIYYIIHKYFKLLLTINLFTNNYKSLIYFLYNKFIYYYS